MTKKSKTSIVPIERIERAILLIRDQKVMLDADLAELYGVQTRTLIQAVKRHIARFPEDFMFQLSKEEFDFLRSQSVISSWGGRRHAPYAFTEHGIAMLSSVLSSEKAVQVNIEIVRSFIRLRKLLISNGELAEKVAELENRYDSQFKVIFDAIRQLMKLPEPDDYQKTKMGFKSEK